MTVKIKKIKYLVAPRDILNDALDVFVTLDDDYCTDGFCYIVEITTPQFLSTIMKKENKAFLSPGYPSIIVSKLTDDIIRDAIQEFIDRREDSYWLKLYHITFTLNIEDVNSILDRKKQEEIEEEIELERESTEDSS